MDWVEEVSQKLSRKNQILFSKDSPLLRELALLLREQDRRAVVLWAFELAEEAVKKLEASYPAERAPRSALEASRLWAAGQIRMPAAKREILRCHAAAQEIPSPADAALFHAAAQACSTVHTASHALGFPLYELTSIVRSCGIAQCRTPVEARSREYIEKLLYWSAHYAAYPGNWAGFLRRDD